MNKNEISVHVDVTELDIAIEKASRLKELLQEVQSLSIEHLLGGEQKRIFYLCDGNVPTCKKSTCYKNPGKKNTCPPCSYTKDVRHALNFRRRSENVHAAYYENGQPE